MNRMTWKTDGIIGLALAAAALGGTAQTLPDSERVTVPAPASQLKIELPAKPYWMERQRFEELRGNYELSNGHTLYLTRSGYTLYGEIDEQGRHPLVASGYSSFVATDLKLKVHITSLPDGGVGGEVLMAVPRRLAATGEVVEQIVALALR